jgi:protein tyrosine phosphatase (PTP) superfamily phosphohydrolase (DUF442 family)
MPETLAAEQTTAPPLPLRRHFRHAALLGSAAVVLYVGWSLYDILGGANFHVVIPGKIYRGSQPSAAALEALIRRHHIRTVVNVRGCAEPHEWYLDQTRVIQRLGLSQEDICFSAVHLPSADELRILLDTLDRAEYPLFVHCRHGADRTGLAAVIALLLQDGVPYETARRELGPRFGHVAFSRTGNLDRFFDLYERWLEKHGKTHRSEDFRHWVLHEYKGGWCNARIEIMPASTVLRAGHPLGFAVRLTNLSDDPWHFKPTTTAGMHLSYQVWDEDGLGVAEGRAAFFEKTVEPGESIDVTLVVPPLPKAGRYRLFVDMAEEFHCWFYQTGTEPWEEELEVRE